MTHSFAAVVNPSIPRSKFDRSFGLKTTFDSGELVPFFCQEYLPGDTHSLRTTAFARLATPLHPLMDNLYLDTHFFAVPNRLGWTNWPKFMGEQHDPGDSTDFTIPTISGAVTTGTESGSLWDYLGLPIASTPNDNTVSAFPFRAIARIWNTWFRDQNLQDSLELQDDDGPDAIANANYGYINPPKRGKRHDYFTSCLPWPSKTLTPVQLPLGTSAPIVKDGTTDADTLGITDDGGDGTVKLLFPVTTTAIIAAAGTPDELLYTDLSDATAATVNEFREALTVQHMLEIDARGGTRLQEVILAHFGVLGDDARLDRPEYLGGGSQSLQITQVPQTSEDGTTPQGHLTGYGTATINGHGFTKSFVEHGYIIGFISVRADLTYQKGIQRHWSRSTRYDFYFPSFANLGEMAVLNKEIFTDGTATDDLVFGYQEAWAEYRYNPSQITGIFRSDAALSLDPWHLSQDFSTLPVLGATFIEDTPPVSRVVAVTTEPEFLLDCYFNYNCVRPMPTYSTPGVRRI